MVWPSIPFCPFCKQDRQAQERDGGGVNSYMGSSTPSIMFPLDETQTETWKDMGAVTNSYMVLYSILFLMEEGQTGLRER